MVKDLVCLFVFDFTQPLLASSCFDKQKREWGGGGGAGGGGLCF